MLTSSRLVSRPSPTAWIYSMTRTVVRAELRYALREVGRAVALPHTLSKRRTFALAIAPSIGTAVAIAAAARRRRRAAPEPPLGVA